MLKSLSGSVNFQAGFRFFINCLLLALSTSKNIRSALRIMACSHVAMSWLGVEAAVPARRKNSDLVLVLIPTLILPFHFSLFILTELELGKKEGRREGGRKEKKERRISCKVEKDVKKEEEEEEEEEKED